MKKYLAVCFVVLLFSSCIKIDNTNLCSSTVPAPALASQNISVSGGSDLRVNVISPDQSLTYSWIGPAQFGTPTVYSGSTLDVPYTNGEPIYGSWALVAQKGACVSDTTKFSVGLGLPSCGIGKDSFLLAGSTPLKETFTPSSNNSFNGYYLIAFQDPSGGLLQVYLAAQPTGSQVYTITNGYYFSLQSGECTINYTGGYGYSSYSGNITVNVSGSVITMEFCNATFLNSYTGLTLNASGYLVGS